MVLINTGIGGASGQAVLNVGKLQRFAKPFATDRFTAVTGVPGPVR
jgi:hypothetical protein